MRVLETSALSGLPMSECVAPVQSDREYGRRGILGFSKIILNIDAVARAKPEQNCQA